MIWSRRPTSSALSVLRVGVAPRVRRQVVAGAEAGSIADLRGPLLVMGSPSAPPAVWKKLSVKIFFAWRLVYRWGPPTTKLAGAFGPDRGQTSSPPIGGHQVRCADARHPPMRFRPLGVARQDAESLVLETSPRYRHFGHWSTHSFQYKAVGMLRAVAPAGKVEFWRALHRPIYCRVAASVPVGIPGGVPVAGWLSMLPLALNES